jgi:hypothetical protein
MARPASRPGVPVATVRQLCALSSLVTGESLVEQVAQIEDLAAGTIDGSEFFRRNYFTEGLQRLVERGLERLDGRTADGAFYLSQAMGGGKTHSLIAFGLLAADPELRKAVLPHSAAGREFGAAKVVTFNGHQNPARLLWGHIAEQLGRGEVMAPFWRSGPRSPGVDEWAAVLGDGPVLVLLDELPSYLQMAQGEPVGNTTLGNLTIGALERLFNALPRCPRTCVVVTNLKDDIYLGGAGQLQTLIDDLTKQYDKHALAITPVAPNTGEAFAIARRRLFDGLPAADRIDAVARAYVDALQQAKRLDTIATMPETFIERIRETYPFHPSIRDIVARFAENRGYQQTRALIRLLRLAVRNAFKADDQALLISLAHLDFNDRATLEEIRKINPAYANAIVRDIADRGNALAERIDAAQGVATASSVAKVLLMSSLSTAETPPRGLTDGELIETLADPLLTVSQIKASLGRLQGQAWYLFRGVDQRLFFGQTANLTAEITEIAANLAEEQVDQTLRAKLREVFKPRTGALYSERMAILPALDDIELDDDRPTLVILERPADKLPRDFVDWWDRQELANRVLVLTADPSALTTLRTSARRMRAIDKVEERIRTQHGVTSAQMRELHGVKEREAASFTSALRETFRAIVFPTGRSLRQVADFRIEFDRDDDAGEQQILDALTRRGKFVPGEKFDAAFETLRLDAEEILFDADAVQPSSLRRNAAVRSGWFWLPRNGFDQLVKLCVQRGFWREQDGLIAKKWERRTNLTVRLDAFEPRPLELRAAPKAALQPDAPVTMTSRFERIDTAAALSAIARLARTGGAQILGGSIEVSGGRHQGDYLTLRVGEDVKVGASELEGLVKTLVRTLNAAAPTVKLRIDGIAFPCGRDLMAFCDASGEEIERVTWMQD